jgi:hypothetical protein
LSRKIVGFLSVTSLAAVLTAPSIAAEGGTDLPLETVDLRILEPATVWENEKYLTGLMYFAGMRGRTRIGRASVTWLLYDNRADAGYDVDKANPEPLKSGIVTVHRPP